MLSTYAELHRHLEEEFDIKVSAEAMRLRLIISVAKLHSNYTSNSTLFATKLRSVPLQFRSI